MHSNIVWNPTFLSFVFCKRKKKSIQACNYMRVCQKNAYSEALRYVMLLNYQKNIYIEAVFVNNRQVFLLKCEPLIHMNWKS